MLWPRSSLRITPNSPLESNNTSPPAREGVCFESAGPRPSSEILEISRWVANTLKHNLVVDDAKRVLKNDELQLLIEPISTRIRSGTLTQRASDVLAFACGVTNGGLPLELLIENPCIDVPFGVRRRRSL